MFSREDEKTFTAPVKSSSCAELATENKQYSVVVAVKKTKSDCPGHASVSFQKEKGAQLTRSHTSFFPSAFGSLLNAASFGSVPVSGQLSADPKQDFEEADEIMAKPISREEYKAGKSQQRKLERSVSVGNCQYSIFGNMNPVTGITTSLSDSYKSSQLTAEKHREIHGFRPPEDLAGIEVYSNEVHVPSPRTKTHNCVTTTTKVLGGAGIKLDKSTIIPNQISEALKEHGFVPVEKDDVLRTRSSLDLGKFSRS